MTAFKDNQTRFSSFFGYTFPAGVPGSPRTAGSGSGRNYTLGDFVAPGVDVPTDEL
jgi:hypothetical protein